MIRGLNPKLVARFSNNGSKYGYHKMWPYEVNLVLLNLSVWGVQKVLVRSVNGCDSKLVALAVCSESEEKASNGLRVTALLWRKRHSTWYNISLHNTLLSLYNRSYKHSDNFKEIIFGKLKKATSPHHWLGILRKRCIKDWPNSWIRGISVSPRNAQQKTQVFDHCVLLCF